MKFERETKPASFHNHSSIWFQLEKLQLWFQSLVLGYYLVPEDRTYKLVSKRNGVMDVFSCLDQGEEHGSYNSSFIRKFSDSFALGKNV